MCWIKRYVKATLVWNSSIGGGTPANFDAGKPLWNPGRGSLRERLPGVPKGYWTRSHHRVGRRRRPFRKRKEYLSSCTYQCSSLLLHSTVLLQSHTLQCSTRASFLLGVMILWS